MGLMIEVLGITMKLSLRVMSIAHCPSSSRCVRAGMLGVSLAAAGSVTVPGGVASGPPGARQIVADGSSRIESRTASSATYLMSDSSYEPSTVPVLRSARHWNKIDPTLAVTPEFGVKEVAASDYDIAIASDEATDVPVSVSHDDWSFGMDLIGAEQSAVMALGNQAVYPLAMTDTALTYETGGNAVKDTLVLSSKNAPDSFTFHVSLENLTLCDSLLGMATCLSTATASQASRIEPLTVFDSAVDAAGQPRRCARGASVSVAPAEGGVDVTTRAEELVGRWPGLRSGRSQTVFSGAAETCDTYYSSPFRHRLYRQSPRRRQVLVE
jgi:hypothetical protein